MFGGKNVNFPTSNYRIETYPGIKQLGEIIEHAKHEHGVKHCYQWEKKKEYKTFTLTLLYNQADNDLEWQLHEQNLVGTKMVWFHKTLDIAVIYPHILQAVGAKHAMGEDPPPPDEEDEKPMSLSEKLKQRKDKFATVEIKETGLDEGPTPQPSAARLLQGNLKGRPITWLLNTASQAEITGQMKIEGKQYPVHIQFGLGRPVHAYSPTRVGLEAILELFTWQDGDVTFEEGIQPDSASVQDSAEEILKIANQMLADLDWLRQAHVYETSALRTEPGVEMTEEQFDQRLRKGPDFGLKVQMNFYRKINGTRTIKEIGEELSLGYSRTLAIAINFLKLGLALTQDGRSLRTVPLAENEPQMIPWSANQEQTTQNDGTPPPKPPAFLFGLGLADDASSSSSSSPSSSQYSVPSPAAATGSFAGAYSPSQPYAPSAPTSPIGAAELEDDKPPSIIRRKQSESGAQPKPSFSDLYQKHADANRPAETSEQISNTGPQPALTLSDVSGKKTDESELSPAVAAMMQPREAKKTQDLSQQLRAIQGTRRPQEVPIETAEASEENPNVFKIGVPSELTILSESSSPSVLSSLSDPRTGVLTCEAFQFFLEREFARAFRFGSEFALIVVSIKLGAETERTSMPLTALTMITGAIDSIKRDVDVLGHFGDRTFAVLLPGINSTQACAFVDRMVSDLPRMAPKLAGYRPVLYCGISAVPHDARELPVLVESAQQAMLEAAKTNVIRIRSCDLPKN